MTHVSHSSSFELRHTHCDEEPSPLLQLRPQGDRPGYVEEQAANMEMEDASSRDRPMAVVLETQLVSRHSSVAERLPVAVRFPAGPRVRLRTVDQPQDNGLGQKKSPDRPVALRKTKTRRRNNLAP